MLKLIHLRNHSGHTVNLSIHSNAINQELVSLVLKRLIKAFITMLTFHVNLLVREMYVVFHFNPCTILSEKKTTQESESAKNNISTITLKLLLRVVSTDTETGMLPGVPGSAICVQKFDDSLNSAIRITYRISLRSSSLREPRHPSLKVVICI